MCTSWALERWSHPMLVETEWTSENEQKNKIQERQNWIELEWIGYMICIRWFFNFLFHGHDCHELISRSPIGQDVTMTYYDHRWQPTCNQQISTNVNRVAHCNNILHLKISMTSKSIQMAAAICCGHRQFRCLCFHPDSCSSCCGCLVKSLCLIWFDHVWSFDHLIFF